MKKRQYATVTRSRWFRVERWCRCSRGHDIPLGTWARWTARHDGTVTCADCLEREGVIRPGASASQDPAA